MRAVTLFFKILFLVSVLLNVEQLYAFDASPFPTQKWETFHENEPFVIKIDHPKIPYQFKLLIQITTNKSNKNDIVYHDNFGAIALDVTPDQTITYVTSNTCEQTKGCADELLLAIKNCEVGCYAAGTLTYDFVLDKKLFRVLTS